MVSAAVTHLCRWRTKAATGNIKMDEPSYIPVLMDTEIWNHAMFMSGNITLFFFFFFLFPAAFTAYASSWARDGIQARSLTQGSNQHLHRNKPDAQSTVPQRERQEIFSFFDFFLNHLKMQKPEFPSWLSGNESD